MELGVQTVPALGEGRCLPSYLQGIILRPRPRIRHDRWLHRQGPPPWSRRKRGPQSQAIGRSRGGLTTKILATADALGNLIDFRLLPGQAHDLRGTKGLIEGLACDRLLADRAFDANWLRDMLADRDIGAVIPPKSNRRFPAPFDRGVYKWRHPIEDIFGKLKEYRGIATRYCKTNASFAAFIAIRAVVIQTT